MSAEPGRRRGRRDNGLSCAVYVPLADVDPRIGEHLLDVLWAAGVPAYLEPALDIEPTRAVSIPSPPTDRLWVDRDRRANARSIVETELPTAPVDPRSRDVSPVSHSAAGQQPPDPQPPLQQDEEAIWQELVRDLTTDSAAERGDGWIAPWPAAENVDPPGVGDRPAAPADPPGPAAFSDAGRSGDDLVDTYDSPGTAATADDAEFDVPNPDDPRGVSRSVLDGPSEDERYVPPPPPPFPRPSKEALLALLILAAGTVLLIVPGVIGLDSRTGFTLGVIGIVTGVGMLIWRIKADRDDDDYDDGARV
ncbi:MAG: hypothetical protein ACR2JQ_11865 [Mycobacteriales bacterium]